MFWLSLANGHPKFQTLIYSNHLLDSSVLTLKCLHLQATVESEFIKKAREGMDNDEATFAVEVDVENKPYLWQDKYRPRKPRFFNRVHTGFEWNKYNQTHYDMDNPPPKIVQGYKFNVSTHKPFTRNDFFL